MRYLTYMEVAAINQYTIEKFSPGEQIGIKSHNLLDSAVNRPKQDAYETTFQKAVALFESIAQNHAFHNANKRTAFLSLTQFLVYNECDFGMDSTLEQADFTVNVVNKQYTFDELTNIIEKYSKEI